jgi:glutamate dehydrogenase/leucine dehydrogenase
MTRVGVICALDDAAAADAARGVAAHLTACGLPATGDTSEADVVLVDKGIVVVPDILANAGGVTSSYFEWAQNRQGIAWPDGTAAERLHHTMHESFAQVYAFSENNKVSLRSGAYAIAVQRVGEAMTVRGLFP